MPGKTINYKAFIHFFFALFSTAFIIPLIYVVSISLSDEADIKRSGYSLFPRQFDLTAYQVAFANVDQIVRGYVVTTFTTVFGTLLSILVMALCAYPLARMDFRWRMPITFFICFTMLFGGGLIPSYILITQYLKLGDTIWIYIFPLLANAFHIIIFRTFFQGLSVSLIESAKLDGAGELKIFFQVILPLSKPVLATLTLFNVLTKWNEWWHALIYIRNPDLYTLQYLLQRILLEAEFLRNMTSELPDGMDSALAIPSETVRFAMVVISAGPMLFVFPFFQKYFAKGLTIGSIKG